MKNLLFDYCCFTWSIEGELESTVAELEEINHQLAALKVEKDSAKAAFLPILNLGSKNVASDKIRDKQKDVLEMESTLKDLQVGCNQ